MGQLVDTVLGRYGVVYTAALRVGDDDDNLEGDFEACKDGVLWAALT